MNSHAQSKGETVLQSGNLGCIFDSAAVHHLSWRDETILRMIFCAVRDPAWGTVFPQISGLKIARSAEALSITYDADYRQNDIRFSARFTFEAGADGSFAAGFVGEAASDFDYARIGLCLLLPWEGYAGRDYVADLHGIPSAGTIQPGIAKQFYVDECYVPSVPPFTSFRVAPRPGITLDLTFEGDEFEMEDQRNWTDSTLKIYSTPLHLGNLHRARAGQRIVQRITGTIRAAQDAKEAKAPQRPVVLTMGAADFCLPPLGTCWPASVDARPPRPGPEKVPALSHLRVDFDLTAAKDPEPPEGFVLPEGAGFELAVLAEPSSLDRLVPLARRLALLAPLHRVIVNDATADNTGPDLVLAAATKLREAGINVPVGGGSDFWFAEINRVSHDYREMDFLSFSTTPQLHVFDDASVFEAATIQGQVIAAARERIANGHVVLSPMTLIPRDPGAARQGGGQPPDPRHDGDFLTAWTAAALCSAIGAGPAALTLYDLFGPHGLMRSNEGGLVPLPALRLLSLLSARTGQGVFAIESSDPVAVRGFGVTGPEGSLLIIANCCRTATEASIHDIAGRQLTITSLLHDMASHQSSGSDGTQRDKPSAFADDTLRLIFAPYEVLCIQNGWGQI